MKILESKKTCTDCKEIKSTADFNLRRASPDGLSLICRACRSRRGKEYHQRTYAAKKLFLNARVNEAYRRKNPPVSSKTCSVCGKIYARSTAASTKLSKFCSRKCRTSKYLTSNTPKNCIFCGKQYVLASARLTGISRYCSRECRLTEYWTEERKEQKRAADRENGKEYHQRPVVKARLREWSAERMLNNSSFKITARLRNRIYYAIKGRDKSASTEKLLGCSFNDFREKLEDEMEVGMTWENFGSKWHIGHLVPVSAFDMENVLHQHAAFNFWNMRPQWAEENLKRSDLMQCDSCSYEWRAKNRPRRGVESCPNCHAFIPTMMNLIEYVSADSEEHLLSENRHR